MPIDVFVDGEKVHSTSLSAGVHEVAVPAIDLEVGSSAVRVESGDVTAETDVRVVPGWLSIVPPLLAIGLALVFKDVLLSLYVGIFAGALVVAEWDPFAAFARTVDHFMLEAVADADHAAIILFSLLLGGMVGVISKSGGTRGIVDRLAGFATDARRGQLASWLMGILVFFDDYANTLIVGSTMRPVTDRLRISREKLAYIVDSTAAPVASLVPISTWIGYELGLIGAALASLELDLNPYAVFVDSIPYRFYPIFALVLVVAVAASGRDRGPMLRAERRAAETGETLAADDVGLADYESSDLAPPEGLVSRARNAVVPILVVIGVTLVGLFVTGSASVERAGTGSTVAWLREVFASSDSYAALMWASLAGVVVAVGLAALTPRLSLSETTTGLTAGIKSMLLAIVVLVLAWSLGAVCTELHTADYVVGLTEGILSPYLVPALVFVTSAAIAFATGTSWATMAILIPLVIPIVHTLATRSGLATSSEAYLTLLVGTVSSVLAGSVWGDHCSPISDTTILSSMASGCDHIAHVRTQVPYALGLGVLGIVIGDIPTAYGLNPWISLAVGSAVIVAAVFWYFEPVTVRRTATDR